VKVMINANPPSAVTWRIPSMCLASVEAKRMIQSHRR
jgi:hypothetical protein